MIKKERTMKNEKALLVQTLAILLALSMLLGFSTAIAMAASYPSGRTTPISRAGSTPSPSGRRSSARLTW